MITYEKTAAEMIANYKAEKAMQDQINAAFAELNIEIAERQMTWAKNRKESLSAKIAELKDIRRKMGEHAYYEQVFAVACGKGWYNIFHQRPWDSVAEIVAKNTAALIAKRDAQIIKALNKAGVFEIPAFTLTEVSDGIEGTFVVSGKVVTIRTIIAGGYNIQCLHQRTLVKVK